MSTSRRQPGRRPPGRGQPGRRRWLAAVPPLVVAVELVGILLVGDLVGAGWTVLLLLAGVVVGGLVLVRGGLGGLRRVAEGARQRAATASSPADLEGARTGRELADAGLVVLGALLLMAPGFVSDVAGLLAVLPPTRPLVRRLLGALAGLVALRVTGLRRGDVVPGRVVVDEAGRGTGAPGHGQEAPGGTGDPLRGRVLPPADQDDPPHG
ncbi:FxsA family protein [Pseudokineococcus sp. 1T1Z-3]|uniref:FxsA family protein n=1 Tax=Pseudokineococcus sp. 1T1Z-3 TaxID=3132745 RepID=UPI0030A02225